MNRESCFDQKPSLVFLSMEDEEEVTIFKLYLKNCQLIKQKSHPLCVSHTSPTAQCPHKYAVLHCAVAVVIVL